MSVHYTRFDNIGRLTIPTEFIKPIMSGDNDGFCFEYDAEDKAVNMIPCAVNEEEKDKHLREDIQAHRQGNQTEREKTPDAWDYERKIACYDIMSCIVFPKAIRNSMGWDDKTTLAVSMNGGGLTVRDYGIPLEDITKKSNPKMHIPPKPGKKRFIEVYRKRAEILFNNKPGEGTDNIKNTVAETLTVTAKGGQSVTAEKLGGNSYSVKVSNTGETVTCLIKLSGSYEEQAEILYDTLINTSVI